MPALKSVVYYDPFGPLPPGQTQAGVKAQLDTTGVAGQFPQARLLANSVSIAANSGGPGDITIVVLNPVPLVPSLYYELQVAWAVKETPPDKFDWKTAKPICRAPVIPQQLSLTELTVTTGPPGEITFSWHGAGGTAIAGARMDLVDATTGAKTRWFFSATGSPASFPATFNGDHDYYVLLSAVQPMAANPGGSVATAPRTFGPPSGVIPIPTKAPAIVQTAFAGGNIAVSWTAPTLRPHWAVNPRYELLLLDGSTVVGVAEAGAAGGQAAAAALATAAQPKVAGRMRFGDFTGPAGPAIPVYPLAPSIVAVAVTGGATSSIAATVAYPGTLPGGGTLKARLYTSGVAGPAQSADGNGNVTWTGIAAAAGSVYEIDVYLEVAVAAPVAISRGPSSARLVVPLAIPERLEAGYDGQVLTIGFTLQANPPVDGYAILLTGSTSGDQRFWAGAGAPISFPVDLDLGQAWTATVEPRIGITAATGSAATTVVLPVPVAPSLTAVDYDGATLRVRWAAAALPFLSGYRVAVSGGPSVVTGAGETHCALPLSPAQAAGARVTVTGLSPLRETAASAGVAIVTTLIPVAAVAVDPATGIATASWTAAPGATGYRLRLTQEEVWTDIVVGAPATSYVFTPPPGAALALASIVTAGGARSTGPFGPAAPLPNSAPAIASTAYDGTNLALAWTPVPGATGYRATVIQLPSTTTPAPQIFSAGTTQGSFALPAPTGAGTYGVVLQALFGALDGPATAVAPLLLAPPTLAAPAFDGRLIAAALTAPAGPAPGGYAVTLLRDGAAIQQGTGTAPAISLDVAEPTDPAADYALVVRPTAGIALGPPAGSTVVTAVPRLLDAAWDPSADATLDVTASLPTGHSGQARLLVDGVPNEPVDLDNEGRASLPSHSAGAFALSLQASAGGATGPWSEPLPLPAAVPSGLALQTGSGVLQASWDGVDGADEYAVILTTDEDASPVPVLVSRPEATLNLPAGAKTAGVSVAAVFGPFTGRASQPTAASFAAATLTAADYDGEELALAWSSTAPAARVTITAGGAIVAQRDFSEGHGSIALAPGRHHIVLRALDGTAVGPASPAVAAMTYAPAVESIEFDPLSGDCTLAWAPVAGADGYATRLVKPGQPAQEGKVRTASCTILATALAGGGPFSFFVKALGSTGLASGPWSPPAPVSSLPVGGLEARFDGTTLRASWSPVGEAQGYRLNLVLNGSAQRLGDVAGPSALITPGTAPPPTAKLIVQAIGRLGAGPPCAPVPLVTRAWFPGPREPYRLAPSAAPAAAPVDIVISLPEMFDDALPPQLPTNGTFAFAPANGGYALTILAGGSAWKWEVGDRTNVRTDYAGLLTWLEGVPCTAPARALVMEAVARAMPQTFEEMLFYAHGFSPGQGWFDLRPGMILRVEYESYQYLGAGGALPVPAQADYLDGFVAAAVADYQVTASTGAGGWFVALDSALALVAAGSSVAIPTPPVSGDYSQGGAGLIDAFFPQFQQPLLRVVYPPNILGQGSVGDPDLEANPVLLAAGSLADLEAASEAVQNGLPIPGATVGSFYFRGRATLTPHIRVTIDGAALLVPLGTSVGDLLSQFGRRGAHPAGLRMRRATGPAAIAPGFPAWLDVRLDWTPGEAGWLDLPLIAGDRIEAA